MRIATLLSAAVLAGFAGAASAQVPDYYPADYQKVIEAGKKEGRLVLYSPLGTSDVRPFIEGFNKLYPEIQVEPNDLNTTVIYNRFISEAAGGAASADVIWSSAADLQAKLINDGYAMPYVSPEVPKIPKWSYWDKGGYGTNFEPYMFIYNKTAFKADEVPKGHADLVGFLTKNLDKVQGKVAAYNIETSGNGFLSTVLDSKYDANFWAIPKVFGATKARFYSSTGDMVESVGSGENIFAYNQPGYFAVNAAKKNPNVAYILPDDFVTVVSRIIFIPKNAKSPNAAKLFLDYMVSQKGQQTIADVGFFSLRTDVAGPWSLGALEKERGDKLKAPEVGPGLLQFLDTKNRLEFLTKWKAALKG